MIDKTTKSALEKSLLDNFKTITVTVPPDHKKSVKFNTKISYLNQFILDPIADKNRYDVVIGIDYPRMDSQWARNISDWHGEMFVPKIYKETTETSLYQVVQAEVIPISSPYIFRLRVDTNYIYSMAFKFDVPVGSTSWTSIKILTEIGEVLFSKILMPSQIFTRQWMTFKVDKQLELNGGSTVLTVMLIDIPNGANPIGFKVMTAQTEDPEFHDYPAIYKIYKGEMSTVWGKISRGDMRIQVFSKDKPKGMDPQKDVSLDKQDIVFQTIDQLRQFIWANWNDFGLNDVRDTIPNYGEIEGVAPWMSALFDVTLVVPDLGVESTKNIPLETVTLDINDMKN